MTPGELTWLGLEWLGRVSWQAAVLVLLVMLVQWLFRTQLSPSWRFALWWLVLIRLMLPVAPESAWSIFNLAALPRSEKPMSAELYRSSLPPEFPSRPLVNAPIVSTPIPPGIPFLPESYQPPTQRSIDLPKPAEPAPALPGESGWNVRLLGWIWGAGVFLCVARWLAGCVYLVLRLKPQPVTNPEILQVLAECRQTMGMKASLAVIATPVVRSPALFGFRRLQLLVPGTMVTSFTPAEWRHVFLHEMAHIRRWDVWTNWLMVIFQALHWFNPMLWLAFSRMRADRELACDAIALSLARENETQAYGRTIIKLLKGWTASAAVPGLVGILEDKQQIKRRIRMIAQFKKSQHWPLLACLLLAALCLVAMTDAQTSVAPAPQPKAATPKSDDKAVKKPGDSSLIKDAIEAKSAKVKAMLDQSDNEDQAIDNGETKISGTANASSVTEPLTNRIFRMDAGVIRKLPSSKAEDHPGVKIVEVTPTGLYFLDGKPMTRDQVESSLALARLANPELAVQIRASGNPSQAQVKSLLECCQINQITRVSLHNTLSADGASKEIAEDSMADKIRTFLASLINLAPDSGRVFYFNERNGILFVRATAAELSVVEQALYALNAPPAQVHLSVKLYAVTADDSQALGFDWFLGNTLMTSGAQAGSNGAPSFGSAATTSANPAGIFPRPGAAILPSNAPKSGAGAPVGILTGVLTDPQFRLLERMLSQRRGAQLVLAPQVTTLSGSQCQIEQNEQGFTLDLTPVVGVDDYSIIISLVFNYMPPKLSATAAKNGVKNPTAMRLATRVAVNDGQTLVLGGCESTEDSGNRNKVTKTSFFLAITPKIIDPAGYRIQREQAMPTRSLLPPSPARNEVPGSRRFDPAINNAAANELARPASETAAAVDNAELGVSDHKTNADMNKQRILGNIYLAGNVRKPGSLPIPSDETFTVSKAILKAGGFSDFADKKKVRLVRKMSTDADKKTFIINVTDIWEKGMMEKDMVVEPEDLIFVPARTINF